MKKLINDFIEEDEVNGLALVMLGFGALYFIAHLTLALVNGWLR